MDKRGLTEKEERELTFTFTLFSISILVGGYLIIYLTIMPDNSAACTVPSMFETIFPAVIFCTGTGLLLAGIIGMGNIFKFWRGEK